MSDYMNRYTFQAWPLYEWGVSSRFGPHTPVRKFYRDESEAVEKTRKCGERVKMIFKNDFFWLLSKIALYF